MPAMKSLTPRDANPANFPCDHGRIPDIGFSFTKPNGQAASASLSFDGKSITDNIKQDTFYNLERLCAADSSMPAMMAALNCGPFPQAVQSCSTLYDCSAPGATNGTVVGTGSVGNNYARMTVFSSDLSKSMACYAGSLRKAFANATLSDLHLLDQPSAAAPSQKAVKAVVMGLAASAAMLVLHHA